MERIEDKQIAKRGFTIVELLIVIVVIAILATITVVSYNGIQGRANESVVASDMRNAANKLELYYLDTGRYPRTEAELETADLRFTKNSYHLKTIIYCVDNLGNVGIGGRSKSRKDGYLQGFFWSNASGRVVESNNIGGSILTACPQYGVSTDSTDGFVGIWGKESDGSGGEEWKAWVKG